MSNIVLSQPGGAGTLAADGDIQVGIRCYLSASGVTAVTWTLLSKPAGSNAVARNDPKRGWYFDPDVPSQTPYVPRMVDSVAGVHTNSFTARAATIKADGRQATDGILAAGSNILRSDTLAFSRHDIGKLAIVRTPVSPCPGTVTLAIGNVLVMGVGTAFLTNIPNIAGVPVAGGGIYVDGDFLTILAVESDTQLHVLVAPTHNAAGKTLYRDCQIATTVAAYVDETHVQLACLDSDVRVSGTGLLVSIGTDDTSAVYGALATAFASAVDEAVLPPGLICMSQNVYFELQTSLVIRGTSRKATVLLDMRKASDEVLSVDRTRDDYGLLSFKGCSHINVEDLSIDGNVPVLGMAHTMGGVANGSGGRQGIFFRESDDCAVVRCGSQRYGSRDELFYADAGSVPGSNKNWRVENCVVEMSNNNSINPANVGKGCIVRGNNCISAFSCLQISAVSAIVSDNIFSSAGGFTEGNGADPVIIQQLTGSSILYEGNLIVDGDSHQFGSSLLHVYGLGPGADATCVLAIRNNQYFNNTGFFSSASSAIIRVHNARGTVVIDGETFDKNTANAAGGTFIEVDGANTGRVIIGACEFRGRAGSNMTRGIVVDATVPAGVVTIRPGSTFGESVTTKWDLGVAVVFPVDRCYQLEEITDPAAPAANQVRVYARDTGGKTELVARFPTGAIQRLAIEP